LLANAAALTRRTRIADRGRISFTVGFMPGLMVTEAVQALEFAHPGLSVSVLRTGWDDQTDVVHDGRVDVSYVRQPVNSRGLQVVDLFTEPRVVVLAATHRLSGKESVSITDLIDEHLLQNPDAVPEWRDIATDILHKRPRDDRVNSYSVEEKLENVARGKGIVVLPESVVRSYHRPGIVTAPITDIGPNHIALAWDATRRSKLIHEFAVLAVRHQPFWLRALPALFIPHSRLLLAPIRGYPHPRGYLVLNRGINNRVISRLCARVTLCALTWLTRRSADALAGECGLLVAERRRLGSVVHRVADRHAGDLSRRPAGRFALGVGAPQSDQHHSADEEGSP
jgi:DNA-binding transcriptional LysR family regulator